MVFKNLVLKTSLVEFLDQFKNLCFTQISIDLKKKLHWFLTRSFEMYPRISLDL